MCIYKIPYLFAQPIRQGSGRGSKECVWRNVIGDAKQTVLQSRAERFVSHYNLSADDTEDIKQIFLETLWFAFLGYDAADPIPLLQYVKKTAVMRQLDYIRTTKNACTVPTQNGYAELRKVMRIYNSTPELSADARIALTVKETGFTEEKVTEFIAIGKATEYPIGIVPTDDDEEELDGAISDELIEDPSISLFHEAWGIFAVSISAMPLTKSHRRISRFYLFHSVCVLTVSAFSSLIPMRRSH